MHRLLPLTLCLLALLSSATLPAASCPPPSPTTRQPPSPASPSPHSTPPTTRPASRPTTAPTLTTFHAAGDASYTLYLPGISAYRSIDRQLLTGLLAGSPTLRSGTIQVYDWPAYDPGLGALLAYDRNRKEALTIATLLQQAHTQNPHRPIYLIAHSGGAGLAAWALEALPPTTQIDQLILLAPALSPTYDLTPTLQHLKPTGHLYAFTSPTDPVLGSLTKVFGTIDRINTHSAGLTGFTQPPTANPTLYTQKLRPMPYQEEWSHQNNLGDHIGWLEANFAQAVLAPLLTPATK